MNRIDMPLTGDFKIVGDVLRDHADKFSVYGYEATGVKWEGSEKLLLYPVFRYSNKQTGLEIGISFSQAREGRNGGFIVMIVRPPNHVLNVEDYLRLHGREDLTEFFTYRDPTTNIRDFAESLLQVLYGLLQKELLPIIQGKTWEDTPIDWMGYK